MPLCGLFIQLYMRAAQMAFLVPITDFPSVQSQPTLRSGTSTSIAFVYSVEMAEQVVLGAVGSFAGGGSVGVGQVLRFAHLAVLLVAG